MSAIQNQTSQMRVDNTTFMIERLAQDCAPYQYIRELTQNSFDAIRRKRELGWKGDGVVAWDVDWTIVQSTGFYKLQITDNGTGMGPLEVERYINRLSSSTGTQSMEQNFGIGAKITAGVENPMGLVYKSWTEAHPNGIFATLWKDFDANVYGLKQYQVGDSYQHYAPMNSQVQKPLEISETGTSVVLMGKTEEENTYLRPSEKFKWLISYLNERYFELPDATALKVREFQNADVANWPKSPNAKMGEGDGGNQMRTIRGKRYFLEKYAEIKGIVNLSNATLYWYILPESLNVSGGLWDEKTQVGAIYQNELYEVKRVHQARAEMLHFGINYGFNRVVIYVKPDTSKLPVFANTARSALLVNGEPLPWTQWHTEFRENMPPEIREMMDSILAGADTGNYEENVKRRWKEIKELFQLNKYRKTRSGDLNVDGINPGGNERRLDGTRPAGTNSSRKGSGGGTADLYAAFISEEGEAGELVTRDSNLPKTTWISVEEGTRENGDLEDRAARYSREENTIYINRDFRVFEGLRTASSESYPHASEIDVKRSVEEWVSLQLTESVMGVLSLQGSPEWSDAATIDLALSSEALTAAVMPRYATYSLIKRQLGSVVGASSKS
jgi:hypothetical protein